MWQSLSPFDGQLRQFRVVDEELAGRETCGKMMKRGLRLFSQVAILSSVANGRKLHYARTRVALLTTDLLSHP